MKNVLPAARVSAAVILMAVTLTACATSPASQRVAVQIPRDCEDLARTVPYPAVTVGMSAKVAMARHRAALGQANGNLVATRECQQRQREVFAAGGQGE